MNNTSSTLVRIPINRKYDECVHRSCKYCMISLFILSLIPFITYTLVIPYKKVNNQTQSHLNHLTNNHDSLPQTHGALNKQLFCETSMSEGYENLIKHIYQLQYVDDCTDQNQKFYIAEHQCNVGLFASLECIVYFWTQAILSNRTFLLKGSWTFSSDKDMQKYNCASNSMDCYFLPLSNCNVDDVLKHENNKSNPSIIYLSQENIKNMSSANQQYYYHGNWIKELPGQAMKLFTQRIIYQPRKRGYIRIGPKPILDTNLRNYYGTAIERRSFTAVLEAYLLRMRPEIKVIIDEIVYSSFQTNVNTQNASNYVYNVENSVSILIRWSDKCWNTGKRYPHPEMQCYTYDEYMKLIKILKARQPSLEYVIVTCDSPEIIRNITTEYKDWMINNNMKFVTNIGDIMQQSSTMDRFSTTNNALLVLLSMLSTIRIQFASKYYFLQTRSFWNTGIFNLVGALICQPLTEYESTFEFQNIMNVDRIPIFLSGNIGERVVDGKRLGNISASDFIKALTEDE